MLLRNVISEFACQTVPSVDGGIKWAGRENKGQGVGQLAEIFRTLQCHTLWLFYGRLLFYDYLMGQNRRNGMDGCSGFSLAKIRGSPFPPLIFIKLKAEKFYSPHKSFGL
jgi:hypothetical protein